MAAIALQLLFRKVQFIKLASDIRKTTPLPDEEVYCLSIATFPLNSHFDKICETVEVRAFQILVLSCD